MLRAESLSLYGQQLKLSLDADKQIEFNQAYAPQDEKWVNGRG
jgi:hypothetical protein